MINVFLTNIANIFSLYLLLLPFKLEVDLFYQKMEVQTTKIDRLL